MERESIVSVQSPLSEMDTAEPTSVETAPHADPVAPGNTEIQTPDPSAAVPYFSDWAAPVRCSKCGFPLLRSETVPCHRCRNGGWTAAREDWEDAQESWDQAVEDWSAAASDHATAHEARKSAEAAWQSAREAWWQAEEEWAAAEQKAANAESSVQQREVEWEQSQTAWMEAQDARAERERRSGLPPPVAKVESSG